MKLRSACPYRQQIYEGPAGDFPPLAGDIHRDVAIVGGGISGALTAWFLTRAGVETVLLDCRRPGQGSTAASTGLLQYELDTSLADLFARLGRERAVAAYLASLDALRAFEPLVAELPDRCGLVARPSLYLASSQKDAQQLLLEGEARRAVKIDAAFLCAEALQSEFGIARPAALQSREAFEVDPYRLTLHLLRGSVERGLEVHANTQVTTHESTGEGVLLRTSEGAAIRARKAVFAMGYETLGLLPAGLTQQVSTYAIASTPIPEPALWRDRALIWESARPYLYARTSQDNRAIIGGADEQITDPARRDALLQKKAAELVGGFGRILPAIDVTCDCAWAGIFAQTNDGLPYIGCLPRFPGTYFALGYGGNGITFSLLAAQLIAADFLGRSDGRAALFRFDRN